MCRKRTEGWLLVAGVAAVVVTVVVHGDDSQYCNHHPDASNPPSYPDIALQYTAKIETSQEATDEITGLQMRLALYREWVYDAIGNRIALVIPSKVFEKRSYILDWNTKQMVITAASKDGGTNTCDVRPVESSTYLFPVLYGSSKVISADSLPDPGVLLGILNWNDTHYKGKIERRGIESELWEWCGLIKYEEQMETTLLSMATYWSVRDWKMPIPVAQSASLPLAWEVLVNKDDITTSHDPLVNSVMYYEPGLVDYSSFLVPQDIYCEGLISEPGHPFPDFSKDPFFSFSLEFRDTEDKFFTWADAWYDFGKRLYRVDHDRLVTPVSTTNTKTKIKTKAGDTSSITATTLLLDYNDGVAFEFVPGSISECLVSLVNSTHGDWATLTGLDHLWADSPNAFFGADVTNYTYYGERLEQYMVVGDWRGVRTDWPPDDLANTDMLWQWTFANKNVSKISSLGDHLLIEKQVPVGVRINPVKTTTSGEVRTLKSSASYVIYDFEVDQVGKDIEFNGVRVFDAYDCFSANWRDHLRFKLDVTSWPEVVWSPLITSTYLNEHWHITLANYGQVSPIRITRVQTIVEEEDEAWVEFVLLYRHYSIGDLDPDLFVSMTPGATARAYLTEAVNNGDIKFEGEKENGEKFTILALHGSLTTVVVPECTTTTSTSTTTSSSTTSRTTSSLVDKTTTTTTAATTHKPGHTTTTPSQTSSTTTSTTTTASTTTPGDTGPTKANAKYTPGDLAGLGIGMLLMGFALGAGGAFLVVVKGVHQTVIGWCTKK